MRILFFVMFTLVNLTMISNVNANDENVVDSSFDYSTSTLLIPVVYVREDTYEAKLLMKPLQEGGNEFEFALELAQKTSNVSYNAAVFFPDTGELIVPNISILNSDTLSSADLELLLKPGEGDLKFSISSVEFK